MQLIDGAKFYFDPALITGLSNGANLSTAGSIVDALGNPINVVGTGGIYRTNKFLGNRPGIEFADDSANYLAVPWLSGAAWNDGGGTVMACFIRSAGGVSSRRQIIGTLNATDTRGWRLDVRPSGGSVSNQIRFEIYVTTGVLQATGGTNAAVQDEITIVAGRLTGGSGLAHLKAGEKAAVTATAGSGYDASVSPDTVDIGKTWKGFIGPCIFWDRPLTDLELQRQLYFAWLEQKAALGGGGTTYSYASAAMNSMGTHPAVTFTGEIGAPYNVDITKNPTYSATRPTPAGGTLTHTPAGIDVASVAIATNTVVTSGLDVPIWQNDTNLTINVQAGWISDVNGNSTGGSGGAVALTNTSNTLPYPQVNASFGGYTNRREPYVGMIDIYLDAEDFSGYGIQEVKITATDGTTTREVIVASPSVLNVNAAQAAIMLAANPKASTKGVFYHAQFTAADFARGVAITVTGEVTPVVGTASQKRTITTTVYSDDPGSSGSPMSIITKYVSNSGSDSNNGDSSASPYRAIAKAGQAIRIAGAKGGVVKVPAGQAFIEPTSPLYTSNTGVDCAIIVRPDTGGTAANTSIEINGGELRNGTGDFRFLPEDLTVFVQVNNAVNGAPEFGCRRCIIDSKASSEYNTGLRYVFFLNASWTAATKAFTEAGAGWVLAGLQAGEKIWIWIGGGTAGAYTVVSSDPGTKTVVVSESYSASDIASGIRTPYFSLGWLATTVGQITFQDCTFKPISYVSGCVQGGNSFGTLFHEPEGDMIRGGGSHQAFCNNLGGGNKYTDNHLDCWQTVSADSNTIVRHFVMIGAAVQGFLANRQDSTPIGGFAITDALIVQRSVGQYLAQVGGGNTSAVTRVKLRNLTLGNQSCFFRPGTGGKYENCWVIGVTANQIGAKHPSDTVDSRTWGVIFRHVNSRSGIGEMGVGQRIDATSAVEQFVDGATGNYDANAIDYHLDPASTLKNRIATPLRTIALDGVAVAGADDIGAYGDILEEGLLPGPFANPFEMALSLPWR